MRGDPGRHRLEFPGAQIDHDGRRYHDGRVKRGVSGALARYAHHYGSHLARRPPGDDEAWRGGAAGRVGLSMPDVSIDSLNLHLTGFTEEDGRRLARLVAEGLSKAPMPAAAGSQANVQAKVTPPAGSPVE